MNCMRISNTNDNESQSTIQFGLFCIHVHIAFNTKADAGSELIKVHWLWIPIEFNNEIYSHVWRLLAFLLCSTTTTMATAKKTCMASLVKCEIEEEYRKLKLKTFCLGGEHRYTSFLICRMLHVFLTHPHRIFIHIWSARESIWMEALF